MALHHLLLRNVPLVPWELVATHITCLVTRSVMLCYVSWCLLIDNPKLAEDAVMLKECNCHSLGTGGTCGNLKM